ncbi:MAG: cadherin-like domain-containing protein, partial [Pseudomonadota bacterium]
MKEYSRVSALQGAPAPDAEIFVDFFPLEERILFDGAAAAEAADYVNDISGEQAIADEAAAQQADEQAAEALALAMAEIPGEQGNEIYFVDAGVGNSDALISAIPQGAEVVLINAGSDGVDQIKSVLEGRSGIDAIHILSHGDPGEINLGNARLDAGSISYSHADALASIGDALSEGADILVYGCDFGQDQSVLAALARATGADVAASDDETGAAELGGDWQLEVVHGSIEATPLSATGFDGLLDAPEVTVPATNLSTAEDTDLTISDISVADADGDPLTVSLSVTNGTITLAQTTGLTGLTGDGTNVVQFTGSAADINAAISGMTYSAPADFNGSDSLTIVVSDGGDTVNASVDIEISGVNDNPTLTPAVSPDNPVASEGGEVVLTAAHFGLTDPDLDTDLNTIPQLAKQILFRLDASNLPENGTLFLDGTSPLLAGSGFSLQDVQDGRLSYKHNGSDVSTGDTDDFAVTFNDGGGSGVLGPTDIIIDLLPVNQTPTIGGSSSVFEGEGTENTFAVIPAMTTQSADIGASLSISDRDDTAANSTITITNINNAGVGTLFWDVDGDGILTPSVDTVLTGGETFPADELAAGRLRFAHDGTEPGGPNPSFDIEVTDAGGGTGTPASSGPETIEIAVTPNNDNPELIINNGLTVDAGDTATISSGNLEATDPDNTDQNIFYVVTQVPTLGELRIDGEILGVGGYFTQADIDSGRLDYRSTSTVNDGDIDTFDFEVRDPTLRVFNDPGIVGADREPDGSITEHTFEITLQGDLPPENGQEPGDPAPGLSGTVEILSSTSTSVEVTERDGTLDAVPDVADSDTATITTSDLQFVLQIADGNGSTFTIAPEETFYQITSPPDNGTLFLSGVALGNAGSFTQADIDAGNLIFVHDGSENHQGKFEFNVTAGTAETFSGFEFDFNAIPTNDPPTVVTTDLPLLPEGATTRVTTQHIALGDVDTNDEVGEDGGVNDPNSEAVDDELWFQLTDLPDNGTLERFDGTDWVAVTTDDLLHSSLLTASVQSAISGLRYVHDGSENHADSFNVRVRDDLPELADTADPFELRLENGTGGVGSANPENISASSTVNVTLGPQNDAPISPVGPDAPDSTIIDANQVSQTTANERLITAEGATEIITSTQLRTVDPDTTDPQILQYRITSNVAHGDLRLNGNILGINSTFTQDDIDNNRLAYTHDGSENFADQFQFIVSDSIADHVFSDAEGAASGISTFEIVMDPIRNDPPTITNTGADTIDLFGAFTHNFGNALTLTDPDLVDVDTVAGEEDFLQITVTLRDSGGNAVDLSSSGGITLGSMNGLTLTDADDNDGNLTFQGTFSDVQAALTNLEVEIPNQDFNDTLTLDVTVDDRLRNPDGSLIVGTNGGDVANGGELNDGGTPVNATNNTDTVSITFRASDDNDAPTATAVPGNKTANEDAVLDLSGYVIDDVDAFGSELTVTLNVASGHLSVDGSANTSDPSTLTLTGTLDEINTHLADLTYIANTNFHSSDGGNSNPDDDQLTITVSDGGASGSGGVNTVSLTPTDIAINPVNDPPTVTVPGTQTLDDGSASITFSNANGNEPTVGDALDADNTPFNDLQRLTVSVPAGTGTLSGGGGLADQNIADDHILIFEGTLAQLNDELDGLTFTPVNNNADTVVPITVEINDLANGGAGLPDGIGGALTATDTFNVQISGQNDPPLVTPPSNPNQSVNEDATLTFSSSNGNAFTVSDPDDFGAVMEATVSVNFGTVTATSGSGATLSNDGTGTLTITGTEDQINAALDGLVYT